MLIAEIRHKLLDLDNIDGTGPDVVQEIRDLLSESKEDLLTADVFGALKYLPRNPYLNAVFHAVARRNPTATYFSTVLKTLKSSTSRLEFDFWPNFPTPMGLKGGMTQPDLMIGNDQILIFVEAKMYSPFGEQQIERELAVGLEAAEERHFFLLLVTPSSVPPRLSFNGRRLKLHEYLAAVVTTGEVPERLANKLALNLDRVLWLNWNSLFTAMVRGHDEHKTIKGISEEEVFRAKDILDDLCALMLLRGIQAFHGINAVVSAQSMPSSQRPMFITLTEATESSIGTSGFSFSRALRTEPQPIGWHSPKPPSSILDRSLVGSCCLHRPLRLLRHAFVSPTGSGPDAIPNFRRIVNHWEIPYKRNRLLLKGTKHG